MSFYTLSVLWGAKYSRLAGLVLKLGLKTSQMIRHPLVPNKIITLNRKNKSHKRVRLYTLFSRFSTKNVQNYNIFPDKLELGNSQLIPHRVSAQSL